MEKITIKAFRAVDEPELCRIYAEEHARVLKDIGVDQVMKPDESWHSDPSCIVICAFRETLGMVAGVRIQQRMSTILPMEVHLSAYERRTVEVFDELGPNLGEMCGLWNAHRFAGRGIPGLLLSAAVALAPEAGLSKLVCFAAEYMAPRCKELGFNVMEQLGNRGEFRFPIATIASYPMVLPDTKLLASTEEQKRTQILALRSNPDQRLDVAVKEQQMEVTYMLLGLNGKLPDKGMNGQHRFAA